MFWNLWTLNYVDYISFSCIDSFHMAHNKPNNFKENFILDFSKNVMKHPSLRRDSIKSVLFISPSVCLSACLPVCDAFFSGSTQWIFLIFWMRIFCHIYKKWQIQILENYICCLSNRVKKTNLDQKQKIWHFNKGGIIFIL